MGELMNSGLLSIASLVMSLVVLVVGLFVLMCRIVGTVIEYIEGHSRRFRKLLKG
mgnify:CR=1 FL=1